MHDRIQDALERLPHRNRIRTCSYYLLVGLLLTGCAVTKKAAIVATGAGIGATAGVLSGGALAPIAGATTTALVADVVTEIMIDTRMRGIDMECAPDTIWTVAEKAVELGGIGLILAFVVIPAIAGWLIPGPTKLNRK